jgi:uncharacterized protein (TIGR03083 family)
MSEEPGMAGTYAAEYARVRTRVHDVVNAATPADLDAVSPATPAWRTRDVLAHLVGVADDAINGRIDGVATDPWTAAQVAAREQSSPAEMLEEWDRIGPAFEAVIAGLPDVIAGQVLFDAFTHERDIRHAVAAPGGFESDVLDLVFRWVTDSRLFTELPTLRFDTEAGVAVSGAGEPVATVGASRFEIVRASTGRRSASEVEKYAWDPVMDVSVVLVAPFFRLRDDPLNEECAAPR